MMIGVGCARNGLFSARHTSTSSNFGTDVRARFPAVFREIVLSAGQPLARERHIVITNDGNIMRHGFAGAVRARSRPSATASTPAIHTHQTQRR